MTEEDKAKNKEQEEKQGTTEPGEGATDTTGRYGTPTREDIASGNFADPFASTDQQSARDRYDAGARQKDLTGQEGGGQQRGYDEQGAGTGGSYSDSGGGGQRSTEEILKGVQDKTQVSGETVTEGDSLRDPLDQETEPDYTFGSGGLLNEAVDRSLPGMDDLAAAEGPDLPTGKEMISDQPTGGIGYPAGGYNEEEGLRGTNYKPGDSPLEEFGKGLAGHFVPGQGLGPTNEMYRELQKGDTSVKEIKNPDGTTQSTVYKSEDGTTSVVKGDTITTTSPDGTVTEIKTDSNTGETTTTTYDAKTREETTTTKKAESSEAGGGVGDPGPEGENISREEMEEWMEQKAGYDWLLENATDRGPSGGEEVNPTREGGSEYGTSTSPFAGAQDQQHSLVGQPSPEGDNYGGGTGDKTGSTDYDRTGAIDPGPDAESSPEMGLYQDDPLSAPPSDASSLLDGGDADDGGFGFVYDPAARREAIDDWSTWSQQAFPEGEEDYTADDTVDDVGF